MKVLWVTSNGGNYNAKAQKESGGWIGAMQNALCQYANDVELGVTFFTPNKANILHDGNVTYMPIQYNHGRNAIEKLYIRHLRNEKRYLATCLQEMVSKIREYAPDLIHIWGIEHLHAGIVNYIDDIPIVVHIQGFMTEVFNSFLPPCLTPEDIRLSDSWIERNILRKGHWNNYQSNKLRAKNERQWAPMVRYWIGRTEWDYAIAKKLSPHSTYFHCEELMRISFGKKRWCYHYDGNQIRIMSVISSEWYKGMDVILRVAKELQEKGYRIKWDVYGVEPNDPKLRVIVQKIGIHPEPYGIIFHGNVDGQTISDALTDTDCFIHPSHIENSSNAIAEAQLTGVPVIAQDVGGNSTMLKGGSGILVNKNDIAEMLKSVVLTINKETAEQLSIKAIVLSKERQNTKRNAETLLGIYKQLTLMNNKRMTV